VNDKPTFICIDCKAPVYDALGEVRERCLVCQWVADLDNPEDQERLRAWFREQEERVSGGRREP
jgi:hypothetical protein